MCAQGKVVKLCINWPRWLSAGGRRHQCSLTAASLHWWSLLALAHLEHLIVGTGLHSARRLLPMQRPAGVRYRRALPVRHNMGM